MLEVWGVSWALGRVEEFPEVAGSPVGLWILMVGSIWRVGVGWILPHPCRITGQYLADLGGPISLGQERTGNSEAERGETGKVAPVSLRYQGPVSGRPVRTRTFPHSWVKVEDSRRGLVLVALGVQPVGVLSDWVGALVGMERMLVWTLLLSVTARPRRRSCLQRPVSGAGTYHQKTWRL